LVEKIIGRNFAIIKNSRKMRFSIITLLGVAIDLSVALFLQQDTNMCNY